MGRHSTSLNTLIKHVIPSQTKSWNGFPCLEWQGNVDKDGYARVSYEDKTYRVSRLVASLYLDFDIDSLLKVCHHCDNPRCIEYRHFFIGTPKQNTQDALHKGRLLVYPNARHHNAEKTHCKRGHNDWYLEPRGTRRCRTCLKMHNGNRKLRH